MKFFKLKFDTPDNTAPTKESKWVANQFCDSQKEGQFTTVAGSSGTQVEKAGAYS